MSLFDELLVAIDDSMQAAPAQLELFFPEMNRQLLGSILGRLLHRGMISTVPVQGGIAYQLTEAGNRYLTRILDRIRLAESQWDGRWFCIFLIFPETERTKRDIVRRALINEGFGTIIDGVWLSPWNKSEVVNHLVQSYQLGPSLISTQTEPFGQATTQVIIQRAWNWPALDRAFADFIRLASPAAIALEEKVNQTTTQLTKTQVRLKAKYLVFRYGLLLNHDANLPTNLAPPSPVRLEAQALYTRIREYCYQ